MQFNSYIFIIIFLPVMLLLYFLGNKAGSLWGKIVLILGSLVFYSCAGMDSLMMLGISIVVNYVCALVIKRFRCRKILLAVPVLINVGILLYFKYFNFALENLNWIMKTEYGPRDIFLPLGISFFTFQQIAYLVAVYREELEAGVIDYLVYILYFPKLLMGPLADPVEFLQDINNAGQKRIDWDHIACGIKIFSFGLFKKALLADTFAQAVSWGYENFDAVTSMDLLLIMFFYTMEIYFDFSGYSDMATGVSAMFNIPLPINFDSPYKALSIRDFWKRWHISLTKFLTKYIYIPLGGSQKGRVFTYINTMIVFLVSGIWHGASWTFILWGVLHGLLSVLDRMFETVQARIVKPVRWSVTFVMVNVLWLLFSAQSVRQWLAMLIKMIRFQDRTVSDKILRIFQIPESVLVRDLLHLQGLPIDKGIWMVLFMAVSCGICLIPENNYRKLSKNTYLTMVLAAVAFVWSLLSFSTESEFIYSIF